MDLRGFARIRPLQGHAETVDRLVASGLAAFGVAETALWGDYDPRWGWALAACATGAALLPRRRHPLASLVALLVALAVMDFTVTSESDPGFPFFAVLIACFSVGAYAPGVQAVAALVLVLADYAVGILLSDTALGDLLFVGFVIVGALALGRALAERGHRLARLEADRAADAQRAVIEERARIARELHDVVAHSMSMVVLQVGGVRRLLTPEQEREREALLGVEATGRQALAEMRRLLGIQRRAEVGEALVPQPSLSQVADLVAQVREAGLPVELRVEGRPAPLPPGLELSAYRIVQEALTNALRHAAAGRADVIVRYAGRGVELEVCDDGRGAAAGNGHPGHGLIGMRERTALYGGELEAGPRAGGGWAVRAWLPAERSRDGATAPGMSGIA